jgi:hypothetical protein
MCSRLLQWDYLWPISNYLVSPVTSQTKLIGCLAIAFVDHTEKLTNGSMELK